MKAVEIFAIAGMELAGMLMQLFREFSNGNIERMSPEEARAAADRVLTEIKMDEAIERRRFETLQGDDDKTPNQ